MVLIQAISAPFCARGGFIPPRTPKGHKAGKQCKVFTTILKEFTQKRNDLTYNMTMPFRQEALQT
jgi:hypothetical protein